MVFGVSKFARPTPSPEQLIQGGNHLLYEAQMLSNTVALLESSRWESEWGWEERTLYTATVESCLVHMRSLMDFFCPTDGYETDSRRQNDIVASDFCATWIPERWDSFRPDWNAISEEVLHMTYLRPEVGSSWPYADLVSKITAMLSRFLDAEDRLHQHLKGQLRGILAGNRMSTAYTPAVETRGLPIDPAALSRLASTGSVPTTTLIKPSLITETLD
jgi:hypothetical protein